MRLLKICLIFEVFLQTMVFVGLKGMCICSGKGLLWYLGLECALEWRVEIGFFDF